MERTITLGGIPSVDPEGEPKDLLIRESELPNITDEELKEWGISREALLRCFAESVELMKGKTERDCVRPIAKHFGDSPDDWVVMMGVRYSALNDPLMDESEDHA